MSVRICLILPAFNEENKIGPLVRRLTPFVDTIVVIDDGSDDNTAKEAEAAGAICLHHKLNCGKGASLRTGFDYALTHNYDAVITMDADGQHDPREVVQFIREAERKQTGIIIGCRMGNAEAMPFIRLLTNRFMSWVISCLSHQRICDSQSGFRLIRREVLEAITISTSRYDAESELIIKACRKGYKVREIPIRTIYRGDEKSKINPFVDSGRFFRLVLRNLLRREDE